MRVIDLKNILNRALSNLEDYDDNAIIDCRPNTYGCQMPFVATRSGYISLDDIEVEENEEFYESNGNDADKEEFCLKKYGEPSSFEDDTWQCEDFWDKLHNQKLESAFDDYMTELYPGGLDLTTFNDILCFDGDDVIESIGGTVEESNRPIRRKQKVVSEAKSPNREIFEYAIERIEEQVRLDDPDFTFNKIRKYASSPKNIPESVLEKIANEILEVYGDTISDEARELLQEFISSETYTDLVFNMISNAFEEVANTLEFPGY